ncbi:helix-turn-helix domain-containing protein [Paeniglutamicibacter sp. NPDC012692]|uniref:helix-turn-helix domain-containing protein n=1 Tax=Paeniglutamicibacter sp. NPDC012692 TaxID=3364388 RepID=UPI0036CB57E4
MATTWMTTAEAGEELGVTRSMVRKLLGSGTLLSAGRAGRNLLIDRESVRRYKNRGSVLGRKWSEKTAWAALSLISGDIPRWIDANSRYRLKTRIRSMNPEELSAAVSTKDRVERYRIHPSGIGNVQDYLLPTGVAALKSSIIASQFHLAAGSDVAEGYVDQEGALQLIDAFSMIPDPQGNVTMHLVNTMEVFGNDGPPTAAIAVDLMDSLSTRERRAGEESFHKIVFKWLRETQ